MIEWNIQEATSAFEHISNDWQRIVDENYRGTPGLSEIFVRNILKHYATKRVRLAIGTEHRKIHALVLLEYSGFGRWEVLKRPQAILGLCVFSRDADKEISIRSLIKELPSWCWRLSISNQDPDLVTWNFKKSCLNKIENNTTMNISFEGDFSTYWQARKKKLRNNVGRYFNRLKRDNRTISLGILTSCDEILKGVVEYGNLENKGWKGKKGTAIHSSTKDGRFYRDLLHDFSIHSNAKIYHLMLDNELIASRILIYRNNIMTSLKITYDEKHAEYAPGRILLYLFLENEFKSREADIVEFYTDATSDQLQWSTSNKHMYQVEAYRNAFFMNSIKLIRIVKSKLKK